MKFRSLIIFYFLVISISIYAQTASKKVALIPWPQKVSFLQGEFIIDKDFEVFLQKDASKRVVLGTTRFLRRLSDRSGLFLEKGFPSEINTDARFKIFYEREGELINNEDESYTIAISENKINLNAKTDLGVLHGLETLLQLLDISSSTITFPGIRIEDSPRFTWRGLMIDVARHYQPKHIIKRNLDAMAAVKMNVFHWHLSDDQGFRLASEKFPKLHKAASDHQYYTHNDVKEIVQYAADRGIRVIPEIDVPGHASAILTAYPELGSKDTIYSIERYAGIFDPTLNPANEKVYVFLEGIFTEVASLFPDEYIHIGGDENLGKHWNENQKIQDFKDEKSFKSNHELQVYFTLRLQEIIKKLGKKIVGWEEIMDEKLEKTAVIHSWKGVNEGVQPKSSLIQAVQNGYHSILSNGYYLDLMHDMPTYYNTDPQPEELLSPEKKKLILGGEASMWGELVTSKNIDSRIWPRTIAVAEKLWSAKEIQDYNSFLKRLYPVNYRLEELGINHLKSRDEILRNITQGQAIDPLIVLLEMCQPLKNYSRNAGGIEYKSYSPFSLFADACNTDAPDKIRLANAVKNWKANPQNSAYKNAIKNLFTKWVDNHVDLVNLSQKSYLVKEILPLSEVMLPICDILLRAIDKNELTSKEKNQLIVLIEKAKQPIADVELTVLPVIEEMVQYLGTHKKAYSSKS